MQKQKFSIQINASKQKVWNTLFDDKTFRDWASIIDEGTYMLGELKQGNEVQFISSVSGYGVTSFVEELESNRFVLFRQMADTKDSGKQNRDKQWTGGTDSYLLAEDDGITTLTVESDIPDDLVEIFKDRLPKAIARVKVLAEK